MSENCEQCGKKLKVFAGRLIAYDGSLCLECCSKRLPVVKPCPKCNRMMVKRYGGRHHCTFPGFFNFKWICCCGYEGFGAGDELRHIYPKLLSRLLSDAPRKSAKMCCQVEGCTKDAVWGVQMLRIHGIRVALCDEHTKEEVADVNGTMTEPHVIPVKDCEWWW